MWYITYTHKELGEAAIICSQFELAGILRNLIHLAIQGSEFSNLTIKRKG
jgi:hypothetical protein